MPEDLIVPIQTLLLMVPPQAYFHSQPMMSMFFSDSLPTFSGSNPIETGDLHGQLVKRLPFGNLK